MNAGCTNWENDSFDGATGFGMCLFAKKSAQSFTSMRFQELAAFLIGRECYEASVKLQLQL